MTLRLPCCRSLWHLWLVGMEVTAPACESAWMEAVWGGCSAVVGEMDEDVDQGLDLSAIRAAPVKPVHH